MSHDQLLKLCSKWKSDATAFGKLAADTRDPVAKSLYKATAATYVECADDLEEGLEEEK